MVYIKTVMSVIMCYKKLYMTVPRQFLVTPMIDYFIDMLSDILLMHVGCVHNITEYIQTMLAK